MLRRFSITILLVSYFSQTVYALNYNDQFQYQGKTGIIKKDIEMMTVDDVIQMIDDQRNEQIVRLTDILSQSVLLLPDNTSDPQSGNLHRNPPGSGGYTPNTNLPSDEKSINAEIKRQFQAVQVTTGAKALSMAEPKYSKYDSIITEWVNKANMGSQHKISLAFMKAMYMQESTLNPNLDVGGAVGLGQIQYNHHTTTFKAFAEANGGDMSKSLRQLMMDPYLNVGYTVDYFKKALEGRNGDYPKALSSYNMGSGGFNKLYKAYPNDWFINQADKMKSAGVAGTPTHMQKVMNYFVD